MAAVGKSLVFYFKYWTEMHRLCETEGGDLEGLPEPDKTREMAQEVGSKATRQAADLLEACTPGLEEHFNSIGRCQRITSRKIVERKRSLRYNIWLQRKPAKPRMEAGIDILRLDKPEIIPWIWRVGGDESEKRLEHILQQKVKVRSQEVDWPAGTIGLDRIPLLPDSLPGFDLEREPLLQQVQRAFKAFSNQDLEALWP